MFINPEDRTLNSFSGKPASHLLKVWSHVKCCIANETVEKVSCGQTSDVCVKSASGKKSAILFVKRHKWPYMEICLSNKEINPMCDVTEEVRMR